MKRIIFFFFIVLITTKISAQPYSNYINGTSTWNMYSSASTGINDYFSHFRYEIHGDTTIGSYDYFKLFRVGIDSVIHNFASIPPTITFDSSYAGALREDIFKCFYFIYKDQSTEYLLYSFDLYPGMSLQDMQANYGCNNPQSIVISYDTVYLGAVPLKRFRMDNFFVSGIIEGVGSGGGLIEQGGMCTGFEANSYLICYKKDNQILVVNPMFPCELTLDATDTVHTTDPADSILNPIHQFSIFPNPASGRIHIAAGDGNQIREVKITNTLGQRLVFVQGISQNEIELNIAALSKAVYFISVKTDKGIITKSIMKR